MSNSESRKRDNPVDGRREVTNIVTRLMDYGKGFPDEQFDDMTIGDIVDLIFEKVKSS